MKVLASQLMVVVGGAREEGAAAGGHDNRSSLFYDRSRFMYEMEKKTCAAGIVDKPTSGIFTDRFSCTAHHSNCRFVA